MLILSESPGNSLSLISVSLVSIRGYFCPVAANCPITFVSIRVYSWLNVIRKSAYQTFLKIFENFAPQIPEKEVEGCFREFKVKDRLANSVKLHGGWPPGNKNIDITR